MKNGCLANTWPRITENLCVNFVAKNALLTRKSSFNLRLNMNYDDPEVRNIVEVIAKVSNFYAR